MSTEIQRKKPICIPQLKFEIEYTLIKDNSGAINTNTFRPAGVVQDILFNYYY